MRNDDFVKGPRGPLAVRLDCDDPFLCLVISDNVHNLCIELDVFPQTELVRITSHVLVYLRSRWISRVIWSVSSQKERLRGAKVFTVGKRKISVMRLLSIRLD